jgi:hypothetical protein
MKLNCCSAAIRYFMLKFLAIRPGHYILVLIMATVGAYLVMQRLQGALSCSAEGYRSDRYMGYCNGSAYGDYDHGAVWFGLEPGVQEFAAAADVLFLGSSRMQFAFSTIATDKWFAAQAASHYLLGFTHTENISFTAPLLARLKPRAKVYIINVDRFFSDAETGPGSQILHDKAIRQRYTEKQRWQQPHRWICKIPVGICGHKFAYFRAVKTGHFVERGVNKVNPASVTEGPGGGQDQWDHYKALANEFVAKLPVDRACVILTLVPYPKTRLAEAQAIASSLGLELITPPLEGLRTHDGSHLDKPSAELWSQTFFDLAGARIQQCLDR